MINVILMSGKGRRFSDKGYLEPKPLINVKNRMMFEYSLSHFKQPDKYVFVVNQNINSHKKFTNFIDSFNFEKEVICFDKITNGQATSLFKSITQYDDDEQLFVSSCDVSFNKVEDIDLQKNIIFTTRPTKHHLKNSKSFGWAYKKNGQVNVSCKKFPKFNDDPSVVIGCFYFSSIYEFKSSYSEMVSRKFMTNNEYYLDNLFNFNPVKKNAIIYNVKNYKSYGSPEELKQS